MTREYKTSEKTRTAALAHYYANRDEVLARARVLRATKPEFRRAQFIARLSSAYGLTFDRWSAMLIEQSGRCAICVEPMRPGGTSLRSVHVDHCHTEGHVRGLLCRQCNLLVGHMECRLTLLYRALSYIGDVPPGGSVNL